MGFTHLQVRSGYSLMTSTIKINKLVSKAKESGFTSLALTDEGVMYGAVSFYQACQQAGIKPIIGMTVPVNDEDMEESANCIILAKNKQGYQNLLKLSSHLQLQDKKGITKTDIANYLEEVFVILPVFQSPIARLLHQQNEEGVSSYLKEWKTCVNSEDLYLGISPVSESQQKQVVQSIKHLHKQWDIPVTAVGDVRYLSYTDEAAYRCLLAMKHGQSWSYDQNEPLTNSRHLRTNEEIQQEFEHLWPEIVSETELIADKCNVVLSFDQRMIPSYPVPQGESAENYLEQLCTKQFAVKYGSANEKVKRRLQYELQIIQSMQFSDYFLIVWDFIRFAKKEGIMVGPGRGSAAGSLVAYLLGITDIDPIKYDLLFERFLNPERVTMPDIDVDFSDHRRDEVIRYVRDKYGAEHVAQIVTFGTFAARSLLRELIKTMEIAEQDATFILKEVPAQGSKSIVESVQASKALIDYVKQSKTLQVLFKIASKLEGLPRHISTHAAGVVISKEPLTEHVPVTASQGEMMLTQYAMKELEAIGLLKMDFLGLRNLTIMEKIVTSIRKHTGKVVKLNEIPLDDQKTYALLQQGKTNGIFQLESQGMQQVLTTMKPTRFEDVVAVNALYRPGPMEFIPTYIKRKKQQEKVRYPHQDLEPILNYTFGVLIYQEQIMQIANKMAGFSLGQADLLRRAVSKKQKDVLIEQQQLFVQGCLKNGYSTKVAEEVYQWIVRFANYGFNRSHAVAYSAISYQLAYLKAHYAPFFLSELISSITGNHDKIRLYLREMKEHHISLLPPSINKSFGKFTVENGQIRMGLASIKGIGHQVIREIITIRKDRPFKHLYDFCLRIPLHIVNRQAIESLILAGAFDETHANRASLLASLDQAMEQGELFKEFEDQPSFFQSDIELDATYIDMEPFSQMKKLAFEKELMGVYVSSHPLLQYRKDLRANGYLSIAELKTFTAKNNMKLSAVIQSIKSIRTKRGDPMAFLTLGDETEEIDAVLFPDLYRNINRWLQEEMIIVAKGKIEERNNRIQFVVAEMEPFSDESLINKQENKKLFIKVEEEHEQETLDKLRSIANRYPGESPVLIYHQQTRKTYQLGVDYNLNLNGACVRDLYQYFTKEQIAITQPK
ncbi:DNA polymerase III subunit alpha [Aquibacillus sediminis]|uniref:DNA polymerase III subunit alpha n=1 Tax=Aquibacillus sediminis TaxID=2574734 RepID=UPI001107F3A3|nr:DNA polymerase III subunit alpha [Aquibacillus sediminis]